MGKLPDIKNYIYINLSTLIALCIMVSSHANTYSKRDSIDKRIDEVVVLLSNNPVAFKKEAGDLEKFCLDNHDTVGYHMIRMWKGVLFAMNGNLDQSVRIFFEAAEFAKKINDPRLQFSAINNIAGVYRYNGNYSKSIEYMEKALQIWDEGEKMDVDRGQLLLSIGMVQDVLNRIEEAETNIREALEIFKKNEDYSLILQAMNELGYIAERKGELYQAQSVYSSMIPLYNYQNDKKSIAYTNQLMGRVSLKMGQYTQAYKQLTYSLRLSDSLGYEIQRDTTLVKLIQVCGRLGRIDEMESFLAQLSDFHKQEETKNLEEKLAELETTHLLNEQKLENEILRAETENQKLALLNFRYLMIGSIAFLVVLVALFITVYRYNEKVRNYSQELQIANTELEKHIAAKTELLDSRNMQLIQASFALAHEIRAKVSTILGASELLIIEKEDNEADPTQLIAAIKESTEELDIVVRDLISRLEE